MWYLSLSARSAASALADPFALTVFYLRNQRNLRENRPLKHIREKQANNKERTRNKTKGKEGNKVKQQHEY